MSFTKALFIFKTLGYFIKGRKESQTQYDAIALKSEVALATFQTATKRQFLKVIDLDITAAKIEVDTKICRYLKSPCHHYLYPCLELYQTRHNSISFQNDIARHSSWLCIQTPYIMSKLDQDLSNGIVG